MASARSLLLAALVACAKDPDDAADAPRDTAAACDPLVTWSTVGDPYLRTWCTACHASTLPEAARSDAPVGVDFDDLEAVRAQAARIEARVVDGTMPPTGTPEAEDTERFLAWLRCGLPE